jgi:hypothetical protein
MPVMECTPEFVIDHCKERSCCIWKQVYPIAIQPEIKKYLRNSDKGYFLADKECPGKLLFMRGSLPLFKGSPLRVCAYLSMDNYLCSLHDIGMKPYGCYWSPFTLNAKRRLVIARQDWSSFCFRYARLYPEEAVPVYKAYKTILTHMLGEFEYTCLVRWLESGLQMEHVAMLPVDRYREIVEYRVFNKGLKRKLLGFLGNE